MKFITEDDLRDLYKKEPFTEYEIEAGTRITPGARQFLADRQIQLIDGSVTWKTQMDKKVKKSAGTQNGANPLPNKMDLKSRKLCSRLNSIEAHFLATAEELLTRDVLLAQKIIFLNKSFSDIKNVLHTEKPCEQLTCEKCTGICEENFSQDIGDCFEISEFHIQLGKGKEITLLHRLRCSLRELEVDLEEYYEGSNEDNEQYEAVISKVNQLVNTLSQLICYAAGGEKCQRKI